MWGLGELHSDLSTLNRLIGKYEVPVQQKELYSLETILQSRKLNGNDVSYIISDIEFELTETISNTVPREVSSFSFFLSINFIPDYSKNFFKEDPFYNEKVKLNDNEPPVNSYSMQLVIIGYSNSHEGDLYNCWHLDRHITGGGSSKVVHPFYHLQNGGNKMEEFNDLVKSVVFTGAPRIPHPPMDLFLAFHFVITNFYSQNSMKNIAALLIDEDYEAIICRAQERMWKPYYSAFNGGKHTHYTINAITPLYTVH
jgi:hypothetical protein